jgi:uncharacterized protein (DUF1697 family)
MVAVFIAPLRAVNLGSHNHVAMSDLRECLDQLGLGDPRSLLQSGNLLFQSNELEALAGEG